MDVNKLKTFYYVALEGSYKKASVYLGVTPSYICKHIKSLEDSLKSKLFTRSHGSQIPTDKGQELLDYVHVIINQVEKIKEITNVDNKQDDIIRIVTTTGVTSIWLIKKLKEFTKLYPKYKLRIITVDEKIDVSTHYADVAILPKIAPSPNIIQKKLHIVQNKLFASKRYLEKFGTPKTISDLDNHKLIGFYHNEMGYRGNVDWHLKRGTKNEAARVPFLAVNSILCLYAAISCDMGITSFPEEFIHILESINENAQINGGLLVNVLPNESVDIPVYFSAHHLKMKLDKVLALSDFFKN